MFQTIQNENDFTWSCDLHQNQVILSSSLCNNHANSLMWYTSKRLQFFIFVIKLFCGSTWWNALSFIPICLLLGDDQQFLLYFSVIYRVIPLNFEFDSTFYMILSPKNTHCMKSQILISVNSTNKIKICTLSNNESHF